MRHFTNILLFSFFVLLIAACGNNDATPPLNGTPTVVVPRALFTLQPTFTTVPQPTVQPSTTPDSDRTAVSATATAIDFDRIIVELTYAIPALGLERHLEGNVAGQLFLTDNATRQDAEQSHQEGVLLELRRALENAELAAVPDDCPECVYIEYSLALEESEGSGWLQDVQLLASIENFMALSLGPHFPPGTILGLRRSASIYAPAHTIAMDRNGRLWAWLATEERVEPFNPPAFSSGALQTLLNDVPVGDLATQYAVNCQGYPVETLYLVQASQPTSVRIACPEFTLPSILLPLYLALDDLTQTKTVDVSLSRPPAALPLSALLDYRPSDAIRLTMYQNGTTLVISGTEQITRSLPISQITNLTTSLVESGQLQTGLQTFGQENDGTQSVLRVREMGGVYDATWVLLPDNASFVALDNLLNEIIELTAVPTATPTATSDSTATGSPSPQPTVTESP